ncbi:MAG: V-type ATP synthase subunit F [Coriobacteriaceae bacterium]|nr:V-type ATP synthase subunit F [Coriobacteriaceae bacterium]
MYKLVVLTDPDNADGFRLAGVDVVIAETQDEARHKLNALIDDDTSGIIGVNESIFGTIDERTQRKIDSIYRPIVISLPIRETLETGEDHRAYLSRLIRRAIGFDITLRRG